MATRASPKAKSLRYIREKGWIASPSTLYGYGGKPGILESIENSGFAAASGNSYRLTEQGLKWVGPERILENQSDKLGSEQHKRLLVRTIENLHEGNMLVVTSSVKHSFDLIAWKPHPKKRYLWDKGSVKGYEAQTSARRDSIVENMDKGKIWSVPMVWVVDGNMTLEEIRKITGDANECLAIKG